MDVRWVVAGSLATVAACAGAQKRPVQDTCPLAPLAVRGWPWGDVPTSARPRVLLDAGENQVAPASVTLLQDETTVATESRIMRSEDLVVVELRPAQPLAPRTAYRVIGMEDGKPTLLARFQTTDGPDTRAPSWAGVTRTTVVSAPARPSSCHTGQPYALLDVAHPDDADQHGTIVYAIWLVGEGRIDPTAPTFILDAWEGRRLILGGGLSPFPRNLRLPETGTLRLIVAAVDGSGNPSVPVAVTLDMSKALPEHPPWTDEWIVTGKLMESLRRAGEHDVHLPTTSIPALKQAGFSGGKVMLRVCVSATGDVDETTMLTPDPAHLSPAFVDHYRQAIGQWKFWPLEVAGKPTRMCTYVTYSYIIER